MKTLLDGELHALLGSLGLVQKLIKSGVLSDAQELMVLDEQLRGVIREARKHGANWIWSKESVYQDDGDCWALPSVDIAHYFGLDGHGKMEWFFRIKHGKTAKVLWDTERSAWYPRFESKEQALLCIKEVNELFDTIYLRK